MCGIHGFVSGTKLNTNADDFLSNGFVAGSLRGVDASGIASIKTDTFDTSYQKLPVSGPMFIGDKFAKTLMSAGRQANTISICHTRAATTGGNGGINDAHPFAVYRQGREMIGVHNGTLTNWYSKEDGKEYKVDSEWALNHIFKKGDDAWLDITGAYCFVWWDSDAHTVLNIALNKERPMYVCMTDDDGMAYASEAGMLHWLMERNRIKAAGKILRLTPDHHYKFDTEDLTNYSKLALPAPRVIATASGGYNYSSHGTASRYEVAKLIATIAASEGSQPDDPSKQTAQVTTTISSDSGWVPAKTTKSSVTADEVLCAKDLHMMNVKGIFQPMGYDDASGEINGILTTRGTECSAFIRNGSQLIFGNDTLWSSQCIGMIDDGAKLIAVVAHPNFSRNNGAPTDEEIQTLLVT